MSVDSLSWAEEPEGEKLLSSLTSDEGETVDPIAALEGERSLGSSSHAKPAERLPLETLDSDEEVSSSDEILVSLSGGSTICEPRLLLGMEWQPS